MKGPEPSASAFSFALLTKSEDEPAKLIGFSWLFSDSAANSVFICSTVLTPFETTP